MANFILKHLWHSILSPSFSLKLILETDLDRINWIFGHKLVTYGIWLQNCINEIAELSDLIRKIDNYQRWKWIPPICLTISNIYKHIRVKLYQILFMNIGTREMIKFFNKRNSNSDIDLGSNSGTWACPRYCHYTFVQSYQNQSKNRSVRGMAVLFFSKTLTLDL